MSPSSSVLNVRTSEEIGTTYNTLHSEDEYVKTKKEIFFSVEIHAKIRSDPCEFKYLICGHK